MADKIANEPSRFAADVAGDQYINTFDLRPIQLTTLANQAQMTENLSSSSETLNYFQLFSPSKSLPPLSIDPDFRQKLDNSPPWPPVVSAERPLNATPRPVRSVTPCHGYTADSCFQ